MSLLGRVAQGRPLFGAADPKPNHNPDDPRLWSAGGIYQSETGLVLSEPDVFRTAAAVACVRVLAESVAALPCHIYEWVGTEGDKRRAPEHPLYELLRWQPNPLATAFDYQHLSMVFLTLWQQHYAEKVRDSLGRVVALEPLHPDWVRTEKVKSTGRVRFVVTDPEGGGSRIILQDDMHWETGLSLNGTVGLRTLSWARDVVGLALSSELYAARLFKNNASPGGILTTDKKLNEQAARDLADGFRMSTAQGNAHKLAVLHSGLKFEPTEYEPRRSQMLETRANQAVEIARAFRVQPHKIGILDRATFANIAQQATEFVQDTLMPYLVRKSQSYRRDLMIDRERFFAEHLVDARMGADPEPRAKYYQMMFQSGSMSPNDIRRLDNMNAVAGGEVYWRPVNMAPLTDTTSPNAMALAQAAALRVVRKQAANIHDAARKFGNDMDGFVKWLDGYGQQHAQNVARDLCVSIGAARQYVARVRRELLSEGMGAAELWEVVHVPELATLALKGGYETNGGADGGGSATGNGTLGGAPVLADGAGNA